MIYDKTSYSCVYENEFLTSFYDLEDGEKNFKRKKSEIFFFFFEKALICKKVPSFSQKMIICHKMSLSGVCENVF